MWRGRRSISRRKNRATGRGRSWIAPACESPWQGSLSGSVAHDGDRAAVHAASGSIRVTRDPYRTANRKGDACAALTFFTGSLPFLVVNRHDEERTAFSACPSNVRGRVAGAIHELPLLQQNTPISSRPSRLRVRHFFASRKNLVQICNFCVKRLDTKTTFCLSRCVGRYFVRGKNRARRSVPLQPFATVLQGPAPNRGCRGNS